MSDVGQVIPLLHCTDLGEVVVDGEAAADDAEDGDEEARQEDDA